MTKMMLTAAMAVFALSSAPAFAGGDHTCQGGHNCGGSGGGMTTAEANAAALAAAQAYNRQLQQQSQQTLVNSGNTTNRYDQRKVTKNYDQRQVTNNVDRSTTAAGGTAVAGGATVTDYGDWNSAQGGKVDIGDVEGSQAGATATAGDSNAQASAEGANVGDVSPSQTLTVGGDFFEDEVAAAQAAPIIGSPMNGCSLVRGGSLQVILGGGSLRWDKEGTNCAGGALAEQSLVAYNVTQERYELCERRALVAATPLGQEAGIPFDWNACMGVAAPITSPAPTKPFVATGHQALPLAAVTKAAVKADRDFAPEGAGDRG